MAIGIRGAVLANIIFKGFSRNQNSLKYLPIRNSHVVSYRVAPPPHSKATSIGAEIVGGAMWWWVLWHLWHESDHITGEFEYPEPSSWSNSELGIPTE